MKKIALLLALVLVVVVGTGCYGPMKLTRSVDDWGNEEYVKSPWLGQLVGLAASVAMPVTSVIDSIILNPISFWGTDVGAGKGTPFMHKMAK